MAQRALPVIDAEHVETRTQARHPGRRNVRAVFASNFLFTMGMSMWQSQLLSIFLYNLVVPDNTQIGLIEGCQGMCQLITGMGIGWATDVLGPARRNLLLRLSTLYCVTVTAFCLYCVVDLREPWAWYLCCCLFAPAVAVQRTLVDTIFADSVVTGRRVQDYTTKRTWQLIGAMMGPLLQAITFTFFGVENKWTDLNLILLVLVGISFNMAGGCMQLLMDQADTLGMQSESLTVQQQVEGRQDAPLCQAPASPETPAAQANVAGKKLARVVRWTILVYDVVRVSFGGLAVKYFGLYFTEELGLQPVKFMWIATASNLAGTLFTVLGGRLCRWGCPRTWVVLAFLMLNNAGNLLLGYTRTWEAAAVGWTVRAGALNGMMHIKQSILMDYTPKKRRGIWNSLDSLNTSFWSGSALLGGWLVQRYSYHTNFQVMGWGFVGASLVWSTLLVHLPGT